jgi:cytochrome b561
MAFRRPAIGGDSMHREERYHAVAVVLHWVIAALVAATIALAWAFGDLHGQAKRRLEDIHQSIGILILVLTFARIGWRVANPPPPLPATMRGWELALARTAHAGFYILLLVLPLTGWMAASTSSHLASRPIVLFGVIPWPAIGGLSGLPSAQMKTVHHAVEDVHAWLAYGIYLLIGLHLLGVLKHLVFDGRGGMRGILPDRLARPGGHSMRTVR